MSEPAKEDGVLVPLAWVIPDEMPVVAVNQAIGQVLAKDELLLTLGYVAPPAIIGGTNEERKRQVEQLTFVAVQAVGRFAMNRQRLQELHSAIGETLKNHDLLAGSGDPAS